MYFLLLKNPRCTWFEFANTSLIFKQMCVYLPLHKMFDGRYETLFLHENRVWESRRSEMKLCIVLILIILLDLGGATSLHRDGDKTSWLANASEYLREFAHGAKDMWRAYK